MLSCLLPLSAVSQTRFVEERRAKGLHPIDEMQRFRLFVSVLCCSTCISMLYVFDLFTKDFRERFELSAGDMATVSTIGLCVCWFVLPYGFLFNYCGPTPLFVIAICTGVTGNLCLALVFRGVIPGTVATIAVFYALICSASGILDSATIVTIAEVFPRNRGLIIGAAKVMTGLSSSIWASLSPSVFQNNVSSFLFFMMSLLFCVSLAALVVVRLPPYYITPWRRKRMDPEKVVELENLKHLYHTKNVPMRRLGVAFVVVAAFLVFFTVSTPLKAYTTVSYGSHIALGTITVAIFICFFIMALPIRWLGGIDEPAPVDDGHCSATEQPQLCLKAPGCDSGATEELLSPTAKKSLVPVAEAEEALEDLNESSPQNSSEAVVEPIADNALADSGSASTPREGEAVKAAVQFSRQDPRYGGSLKSNLLKPDVWLILFGFAFQSAIGNMVLYNSSTISVAMSGRRRTRELSALYTAFLGVGSAVGRIAMGAFEAYVQHQKADNRRFLVTMGLPLPPILAVIACILILVLPGNAILFPYVIVYFEEGFFNAIRAIIYPCIFENHHPVYYNMSFMSSIISIVCFNRLLFGFTVDKQHDDLGFAREEDCNVKECVRVPIIVACVLAALAAVMQAVVHVRYSRFVQRVHAQNRAAAAMAETREGTPAGDAIADHALDLDEAEREGATSEQEVRQ